MNKGILTIGLFVVCVVSSSLFASSHLEKRMRARHQFSNHYLAKRICAKNQRYSTLVLCLDLLSQRHAHVLVETGTSRCGACNCGGDGCSTIIFGHWARDNNATLFSVDIDPDAIRESQVATYPINPKVRFFTEDSISFLQRFPEQIDFLYLDSYDFDENNPLPSQQHHLKEIEAAYPLLHDQTVVMIDDCGLPHGGKGALAIEFLLSKGWEVLLAKYQTILVHPNSINF